MKNLQKTKSMAFVPFLLISVDLFASTESSSVGSDCGIFKFIVFIFAVIYSIIISIVLFYKVKKSHKVPDQVPKSNFDWDYNELRHHAKKTFLKMQNARMCRNIDTVKEIITESLYTDYKAQLEEMEKTNKMNVLSQIEVKRIRIIGCEDYLENCHDRFIAHIHGEMIDYTIDEVTGDIIDNLSMEKDNFTDTYHFIRTDKEWVLDYIDNFATIFDVIRTKNYQENINTKNTPHSNLPLKVTSKN